MRFDEALKELGLDDGATATSARRAYLRLLKTRKPETDPEGFMRLREAYEAVHPMLQFIDGVRAERENVDTGQTTNVTDSSVGHDDERVVATMTPDGIVFVNVTPPGGPDKPVQDEPAQDKPSSGDAAQDDSPSYQVANAGGESESEPVESGSDSVRSHPLSVEELIAAGDLEAAADRTVEIYREAKAEGIPHRLEVSPGQTVYFLLDLHAKNASTKAKSVSRAFKSWLNSTGDSARLLPGSLAVLWMIARELSALPPSFPAVLRSAIAKGALEGKFKKARSVASGLRLKKPSVAKAAKADLEKRAPMLADWFGEELAPYVPVTVQPEVAEADRKIRPGWISGILVVALLALRHGCNATSDESYIRYVDDDVSPPAAAPRSGGSDSNVSTLTFPIDHRTRAGIMDLAFSIEARAKLLPRADGTAVAHAARLTYMAFVRRGCHDAMAEVAKLVAETKKLSKESQTALEADVSKLASMLHAACTKTIIEDASGDTGAAKP